MADDDPKNETSSSSDSESIAADDGADPDYSATVHAFHPLFLHSSDNPGQSLLSVKLSSPENFRKWNRGMQIILLGKNKLGFVTGSCKRSSFAKKYHALWDRCDAVVRGWIINSVADDISDGIMYLDSAFLVWREIQDRFAKINGSRIYQLHYEIVTARQGTATIQKFFTRLKNLWTEYDTACSLPFIPGDDFKQHIDQKENDRLFQFLMGLNDSYANVRSNLLIWSPLPTLNQAYAMLVQEEAQRNISASIGSSGSVSLNTTLSAPADSKLKKLANPNLECDFCNKKGHTSDRCYAKGCSFCQRKGHSKENCFKHKELLEAKALLSKTDSSHSHKDDSSDCGTVHTVSSSAAGSSQGSITLSTEQFDRLLQRIGGSGSTSNVATAITSTDGSVHGAGPLKWEGLGKW